ncbi:hypothetical protein BWI17_22190 [Betaproteobacteria bacterium GR16-43]|nr:hypothetical protein BWI17_22190 [Betaproteobacteria bacterium GR16-43]
MRILLAILVVAPALGFAQDFQYERVYPDSALAIVSRLPGDAKAAATTEGLDKGYAAKVTYTGGVRPLSAKTVEALKAWAKAAAIPEQRIERYVREFEFEELGLRYWLPVAEGGDYAKYMVAGEKMQVFVRVPGTFANTKLVIARGINRGWDRRSWRPPSTEASEELRLTRDETQAAMQKVVECLGKFAQSNPGVGVPESLAALGPGGTRCLEANVASGSLGHHAFQLWPAVRDATGRSPAYLVCARPTRPMLDGVDVFAADERGLAKHAYPDEDDGIKTCTQAAYWDYDPARHLKACLVAHADPKAGYPANLQLFGPKGNRCMSYAGDGLEDLYVRADDVRFHYEPEMATPISRHLLRSVQRFTRYGLSEITTEGGERLAAREGSATRQSESREALEKRLLAIDEADRQNRMALTRTCDAGNAQDCYALAHAIHGWGDYTGAYPLWHRACAGGVKEACLFDPQARDAFKAAIDARCAGGDQRACAARYGNDSAAIYEHSIELYRACEKGRREACTALSADAATFAAGQPFTHAEPPRAKVFGIPPR